MKRTFILVSVLVLSAIIAESAYAGGVIYSGTKGYERISRGVFDLGVDTMLLVSYHKTSIPPVTAGGPEPDVSTLAASWLLGITPRYYLIDNLSLGLSLNYFYGKNSTTTTIEGIETTDKSSDMGFLGFVAFGYNLRIGHSLFWRPGIGVGGFYGWRKYPTTEPGLKRESKLYGGAVLIQPLCIQFFAGPHFNLKASPDLIIKFGKEQPADADAKTFTSVEVGISAGIGYNF